MIQPGDLIAKFKYTLENGWGYILNTAGIVWTEARQRAATNEMTKQYGAQWIGHHVSDCSGLFSWAFKQLGGYMYHGSNTMYRDYCTAKGELSGGRRTDGQPLLPGTAVFTGSDGDHGHVGLYIGGGEVIEAQGTKAGVIKSKVSKSKWTFWGELKGVDYSGSTPEPAPDPQPTRPNLRRGSRGDAVRELQESLMALGYDVGLSGVDGIFGQATERAVRAFQAASGLVVDGIVGPLTWTALEGQKPAKDKAYRVTITGVTKEQACELLKSYPLANMEEMV